MDPYTPSETESRYERFWRIRRAAIDLASEREQLLASERARAIEGQAGKSIGTISPNYPDPQSEEPRVITKSYQP